ncbi:hypothetical protein SAY86_027969 [Trapa natans]|uniref:Uncharacterized protein n=1 Tax=Trapa natans TaxID=22666 RepID=A0AAN7LTY8_TRANT|nr:hypothetical protein SAY86_027969 [Trapa natans]
MGYVLTETGRMAKMLTPGNPDEEQMEVEPVEGDEATAVMESEGKQEKKLAAMDEEDKPIPVMYGVRSKGKGKRL